MALFKILRGNAENLPKDKKDGYAYFCTDTHDFYIDYTDNSGQLTRGQLNANVADKLSAGRNISLGTAVSSTATTFDGSKNITIPVTSINEAYLEWGGKNRQAYSKLSPIDYILSTNMTGNKLAFLPEDCIKFESSIDGGITWTEFTSDAKKNMFSVGGLAVRIGNADNTGYKDRTNYRVRITINAWGDRAEGTYAKAYTTLYKFLIHCSTNGSEGSWVTIETRSRAKYLAGDNTWSPTSCTQQTINGWSGTNTINVSPFTFGGGPTQTSHTGEIRFTFGVTSHPASSQNSGLIVDFIEGYGGDAWAYPSTMSKTGHLYSYDNEQNATFPKKVTAATLASSGNATVAGTLSVNGTSNFKAAMTATSITASGKVTSSEFVGDLTGNADTATEAVQAQSIAWTYFNDSGTIS